MKNIYFVIVCMIQSTLLFAQPCTSNFLTNPSFETAIQPSLGNNFPSPYNTFNGWSIPTATAGVASGGFNVIKVDGTSYFGGPDNAHGTGNQYVDINSSGGYVEQSFTLSCPATITFSSWFSRREAGGSGFSSYVDINSGATIVATSSIVNFTSNESEETWKQVTGSANLPAGTYTYRIFMDDFTNVDDAFLCASSGCLLPINLTNFSAISENCLSKLNWQTSSEINSNKFDVEYSIDAANFKTIGSVFAKNINTGSSYNFYHKSLGSLNAYYRLKLIDADGKFSYSKIITVNTNCETVSINAYPNPAIDILHININNHNLYQLVIFNAEGKLVYPSTILQNGDNIMNIKNLSKGNYIVKVFGNTETKVMKITKM